MADTSNRSSAACFSRRQSGRLQRCAPASLQINRSPDWNVAIPLLSPLAPSSPPIQIEKSTADVIAKKELRSLDLIHLQRPGSEAEKPIIFKKWQHPAAPFCCEPAPRVVPFVPV